MLKPPVSLVPCGTPDCVLRPRNGHAVSATFKVTLVQPLLRAKGKITMKLDSSIPIQ